MTAGPQQDAPGAAAFGEVLRSLRLRAGLSQEALAERAGLSGAAISALEQGLRRSPYPHTLRALAAGLGLSPEAAAGLADAARRPSSVATKIAGPDASRPASPPKPLTRLVGREAEIDEVRRLLDDAPLVTLVGPGGIGKTRLALEVLVQSERQFRDGAHFADLSPIDTPTLIASTVAAAVGVREQARASPLNTLSEALGHRHTLLVLDNCEHLIRACAVLVQQLLGACPGLHILATSREPLGVSGERVWPVPPLAQPDAGRAATPDAVLRHAASRLFVERVQAALPGFDLDDDAAPLVAEIVRRLDGIPLALELAATRVRALGLVGLADHLDDRLRLLVGGHSAPARQQTLRATLDWSYDLLGPPERQLFIRLAPFAGDWSLADAEAVCGGAALPRAEVAPRLATLVDQSMLVVVHHATGVRYRLLETMRQYAAERLNDLGQAEAAYRAHCEHYLAMAERVPAERYTVAHLDWLAAEADNLRAALRWCIDRDQFTIGFRLAAALQGLWYVRGALSEGRAWLRELLERAGPMADTVAGARAVGAASRLAFMQGDLAEAGRLADRAWDLAQGLGDERGLALMATRRAVVARGRGDLERARQLSADALQRSRAVGDPDLEVFSLYGLSMVLVHMGQWEPAAELARECLAVSAGIGHAWGLASAHRVRGSTHQHSEPTARRHLEESLAISRRLGYAQGIVYALTALGQLALTNGDARSAGAHLCESLQLAYELGDRLEVLHCLEGLVQTRHAEQGVRLAGAAAALRLALAARPSKDEHDRLMNWLARSRRSLGEARFEERFTEGQLADLHELVVELATAEPDPAANGRVAHAGPEDDLTEREREVARLVGQGLSTRAIAEQLVITRGTAKVHIARILSKLNLHSRAQLAIWAVERRLQLGDHRSKSD